MHEAGIAQNIIQLLEQRIQEGEIEGRISKIFLQVGRMRGVVRENLKFLFHVLARGSALEGSALEIETLPVKARCKACDENFEVVNLGFCCPQCLSVEVELVAGTELLISAVEVN